MNAVKSRHCNNTVRKIWKSFLQLTLQKKAPTVFLLYFCKYKGLSYLIILFLEISDNLFIIAAFSLVAHIYNMVLGAFSL